MEPFKIEETSDAIMMNRLPQTEEEEWELEKALRTKGAKMVDNMVRKLIQNGHVETITYPEMKKAMRQIKKNHALHDGFYAQLITREGIKCYGPGTPEQIFQDWERDNKK